MRQTRRLRVPVEKLKKGVLELGAEAARYVLRVHRLRPGGSFVVFDPAAELEADAELLEPKKSTVLVKTSAVRAASLRPTRSVTLVQAMAKGSKLDQIVRDATELGATRFAPALAARSVKRARHRDAQHDRLRRVALQAARQCGRGDVPRIMAVEPLVEALHRHAPTSHAGVGMCLHPPAEKPLKSVFVTLAPTTAVTVVVGPEGGLCEDELERARSLGYELVSLGQLVLRTETVCAAVLGALLVFS